MFALAVRLAATALAVSAGTNGPNPFLEQAKRFYEQVRYERCAQRLRSAPQWQSTPTELVEIEVYAGLCDFHLNKTQAAAEHFELALKMNPAVELPGYSSPKAVALFKAVERRLKRTAEVPAVLEASPPEPLQTDVPLRTEPRVPDAEIPSPSLQAVDVSSRPSVIQKHRVPVVLGAVAFLATGVGVGFNLQARSLQAQYQLEQHVDIPAYETFQAAQRSATTSYVAFSAAAVAASAAIVTWIVNNSSEH